MGPYHVGLRSRHLPLQVVIDWPARRGGRRILVRLIQVIPNDIDCGLESVGLQVIFS